ncbi:hypothetical protein JTB14_023499 [Gonioctena quinquepunctata]|nr:hypothetical protein JTB14_023499 [Gonioctena quinquepunctata]
MDNLDISKMTSDEAFALLDEETSDQEGVTDLPCESLASTRSSSRLCPSSSSSQYTPTQNVHSAPVPSTSSSRPKTLRKIITPRKIRHHQSSTVDLEEPEPYSSDDSLKDPEYSVDKQNKNKKPSHRPAFVFSSKSSEVSEEEVIEAEVAPPKVNACNEPGAIKWQKTSPLPNLSFKSFIFDRPFGLLCSISTDDNLSIFQTSFDIDGNYCKTEQFICFTKRCDTGLIY